MRAEDFLDFIRHRPFLPFRIFTTDGRTYDVYHPDQVIVLRSRVIIGVGGDGSIAEHAEHVALLHVVRLQEIEGQRTKQAG